ncbi:MAG: hypothetical protein ACLPWF_30020 [Bryobacteraceae bacterium]
MDNNGSNSNERIELLKKREAEIRAKLAAERVKQQKREWKDYERLKTIIGGALLANAAENADFELMLKGVLKTTAIISESDKKLLRSKGWL